jgi:hypothetical protein
MSRLERKARVAARFYSLIEYTKLAGVEYRTCFGEATRRAIRTPGSQTGARSQVVEADEASAGRRCPPMDQGLTENRPYMDVSKAAIGAARGGCSCLPFEAQA